MVHLTLASARATRDGGIHAVAALDFALTTALAGLPAEQAQDLKHTFGRMMGETIEYIINPAGQEFPELTPEKCEWNSIVTEHSARLSTQSRTGAMGPSQASASDE